jgi:hypothetical protein
MSHAHVGTGCGVSARLGSKSTSVLPAYALMIRPTWPAISWPGAMPETVIATPLRTWNGTSRTDTPASPLWASTRSRCCPSARWSVENWNVSGGRAVLNGSTSSSR